MSKLPRLHVLSPFLGVLAASALVGGCSGLAPRPLAEPVYEATLSGSPTEVRAERAPVPAASAGVAGTERGASLAYTVQQDSSESSQGEAVRDALPMDEDDVPEGSGAEGAAGSNPLAAVSKIDLGAQYIRTNSGDDRWDYSVKASTMLHPRLKLNLEAHYWDTDVTGDDENDFESLSVKPIWFPFDMELSETWGLRTAAGVEYIKDFDNDDKGIGTGTDQIGPLFGLAFMNRASKTVLIPLVQHFEDVGSGPDISTTAMRLIALQPLPDGFWAKADIKVPYDWENEEWPANAEVEGGKMLSANVGLFLTGLTGLGGDKPYDWGAALSMRINF